MVKIELIAKDIIVKLKSAGHQAVYAGGCVRDMQLGHSPKDIDIATSASCSEIKKLFPKTVGVGQQFGIMVVLHKGFEFECAHFRNDIHNYSCKNFKPRE